MYCLAILSKTFLWMAAGWLCLLAIAGMVIWLVQQNRIYRWQHTAVIVLMGSYVFIRRYPILNANYEINPDESQLLAQALTLWHHAIYWRFVDGATMGPLSSYLTAVPALLGFSLDYVAARWIGFTCTLTSLILSYLAIRNLFSWGVAMLALLPAVAFIGYTQHPDFVHNTNEQLSLVLISSCLWQFSYITRHRLFDQGSWLFWLSFTASLVPFAKLQGTLSVLIIVVAAFLNLLNQRTKLAAPLFNRALAGLLAGGVVFPLIFVTLTVYFGVFNDFINYYIKGNAVYGSGNNFLIDVERFGRLLFGTQDFSLFLLPTVLLVLTRLLWPTQEESRLSPGTPPFCFAFLLISLYAVIKPGSAFAHYLLYLTVPVSLLNAYLIATIRLPTVKVGIGLVLLVYVPIAINEGHILYTGQQPSQYKADTRKMTLSSVAKETLKYARPGEDLVVWGWMPRYNVQTQMPQGVADNHVIRCLLGDAAVQRMHRARYIQNIRRSKPPVFIDSVGENCLWLNDRSRFAHELFPQLNEFISKYYQYVGETERTRIYVRNDRYKLINAERGQLPTYVD